MCIHRTLTIVATICSVVVASNAKIVAAAAKTQTVSRVALAARSSAAPMKIEVVTQCDDGATVFRIVNSGDSWPKAGLFKIYRTRDRSEISARRMRLAPGQQAAFKVKKKIASGDELGLWIEPGWYSREFSYDARVRCP